MTRVEAKQIISDIDKAYRNFTADEYKALDMAIQALSQEPSELLIIKCNAFLAKDLRKEWADRIIREKESGVLILPPYFEPVLVPNDIEIFIEQEPSIKGNFKTPEVIK